jgi:hypothetical protein
MKNVFLLFALVFIGLACQQKPATTQEESAMEEVTSSPSESTKKLRHVVMFKFKDNSSEEAIDKIVAAFENLPNEISEIKGFEWGLNNSPEGLNDSLTHVFTLTFDSEEGRATYLPHPAHKAFGELLGPDLDKVLVVDYWNE